jgi:hypothetical protein
MTEKSKREAAAREAWAIDWKPCQERTRPSSLPSRRVKTDIEYSVFKVGE